MDTQQSEMLRLPALTQLLGGTAKSTIYELMEGQGFPRPVKLSVRAVAWYRHEVETWLASRKRTVATTRPRPPVTTAAKSKRRSKLVRRTIKTRRD